MSYHCTTADTGRHVRRWNRDATVSATNVEGSIRVANVAEVGPMPDAGSVALAIHVPCVNTPRSVVFAVT